MGGSKIELEPHILPRLMPDMRIYNFQIPRTTPTNGLKKLLFQGVYEVRKGPPLWKWSKIDQLYIFLAKWWIFVGPKVFPPLPQSKWGIVKKKLARIYVLVVKTFKNSTAERVQPAPIYLRYIRIPFQINCRASAERVQLGPIYLRYISLASQSFLLPC